MARVGGPGKRNNTALSASPARIAGAPKGRRQRPARYDTFSHISGRIGGGRPGRPSARERTLMAKLNINGKVRDVQAEPETPLLWVIREQVGLTGTKFGCGIAQCGACSVHING